VKEERIDLIKHRTPLKKTIEAMKCGSLWVGEEKRRRKRKLEHIGIKSFPLLESKKIGVLLG
jgi:hypothetical protein